MSLLTKVYNYLMDEKGLNFSALFALSGNRLFF